MSVKQPRAKKAHQPKKAAAEKAAAPQKLETEADQVDQVVEWLLAGNSPHDVVQAILHTWPAITEPQAHALIGTAYQGLGLELHPEQLAAWHREARRELYRRALEIHDYKTAHAILKELASLDGTGAQKAHPPESQPTTDDGIPDGDGLELPTM